MNAPTSHASSSETLCVLDDPAPAAWIPDEASDPGSARLYPEAFQGRLLVDAIHAGDVLPSQLAPSLSAGHASPLENPTLVDAHAREKDWGSAQVAQRLAHKLGLPGFWRVNIARCLMDFGRFPGETHPGASHLQRFAINDPSARFLRHDEKRTLLRQFFDPISDQIEALVSDKLLKIAVHTYDKLNIGADTRRPLVSLIYRPVSYQDHNRLPFGVFDRLYPDHLAEFTTDRRLVARLSLELEKEGITVASNHPYQLPEGSVEVRSQVWFYFRFLRRRFDAAHPECARIPAYASVWEMLLDTNLRSVHSDSVRSYLHLFRTVAPKHEATYQAIRDAYEHIRSFAKENKVARHYRIHPERPSSLALEVRKDFVWRFEDDACRHPVLGPEGARWDNIETITDLIARAIRIYLSEDRAPDPGTIPEGRPRFAR